ncbi:arylamine N-acetyltransferase [Sphingomonas sp.]|uniref:arylamine N-acetyltransferase family protein n=1 Tax=Sphingomonas sp. TaxID=28214 RepID=UPI001B2E1F94|nr:arylamine N-acetyltransferase [Sphingomonas sp.]MBO9714665.1 arylamine N-acetyltransferase [Sphingomonas sp.]
MDLGAYFARIGYSGPRAPDLATLTALTTRHVASVPFDNLDVQLGRPVTIGLDAAFAKLVGARRGGWCFEQNGLFGCALGELGFSVRRIAAGVMRAERGDAALGNHLALIVTLEGADWLVDVGFGGSQARPIPLAEGEHPHSPYRIRLVRLGNGYWRLSEWTDPAKPFSFDFAGTPADEALLAAKCEALQVSAESPFVQNLVVQQRHGDTHLSLRGRVLVEKSAAYETRRLIESADDLVETIATRFGMDVPEVAGLWERVRERHEALFPSQGA